MIKKIFSWVLVAGWMLVIYAFSNMPNLASGLVSQWDLIFRKIAHMAEFFILAYFLHRAFRQHPMRPAFALFFALAVAFLYAIIDEYHQSFIVGRSASPKDVMIDALGLAMYGFLSRKNI